MVILINEDPAYISWLKRHRNGFVLDTRRNPTRRNTVLHRANCPEIKTRQGSRSRKTSWTTGQRVKACSVEVDQLLDWVRDEINGEPQSCEQCEPLHDGCLAGKCKDDDAQHLTRLGGDIVSYIVEVAVIHLDNDTPYRLSVVDVASYLRKSPAQINAAVLRVIEDSFVSTNENLQLNTPLSDELMLYPTAEALRTVPAFAAMSEVEIAAEVSKLHWQV